MDRYWKPAFMLAWFGVCLYILLSAALGTFFDPKTASAGLNFAFDSDSGRIVIKDLQPEGAAQRSGLQVGDLLNAESTQALVVALKQPPKRVPLVVDRSGSPVSLVLVLDEVDKDRVDYAFGIYGLVLMAPLCLLAAALLGLARTGGSSFKWLAVMLLAWAPGWAGIAPNLYWYALALALNAVSLAIAPLAMFRFWLNFCDEQGVLVGKAWTRAYRVLQLVGLCLIVSTFLDAAWLLTMSSQNLAEPVLALNMHLFGEERSYVLWVLSGVLLFGACTTLPVVVMRRSRGEASNAAFWISAALLGFFIAPAGYFVSRAVVAVLGVDEATWGSFNEIWTYTTMPVAVLSIVAFIRLALKRKMMSFGFAVNLTSVYLVTGGILVGMFWLLKKNIEALGFVNEEAQSALLSATIAGLAFVAKQLKGSAQKALKRLIFVDFNRREARLEEFKSQMSHHKTLSALDQGALSALAAFCHGAQAEVFFWDGKRYVGASGGSVIAPDHELPLKLRATRAAFIPDTPLKVLQTSVRLAAPAFHRFEMVFFVLVEESEHLPVFRPDEIRQIQKLVARWAIERSLLELDGLRAQVVAQTA